MKKLALCLLLTSTVLFAARLSTDRHDEPMTCATMLEIEKEKSKFYKERYLELMREKIKLVKSDEAEQSRLWIDITKTIQEEMKLTHRLVEAERDELREEDRMKPSESMIVNVDALEADIEALGWRIQHMTSELKDLKKPSTSENANKPIEEQPIQPPRD